MQPEFAFTVQATTSISPLTGGGASISTSIEGDWLQLYHGSTLDTVHWIADNGPNFERMVQFCPGAWAFFSSTSTKTASLYADITVASRRRGEVPALLGFKLPLGVVMNLITSSPPLAGQEFMDNAYYFLPAAFPLVNSVMIDRTILSVADLEFDE